jgi:hypothetical protein
VIPLGNHPRILRISLAANRRSSAASSFSESHHAKPSQLRVNSENVLPSSRSRHRKASSSLPCRLIPLYSSLNVLSLTNLTEISCNLKQPIFSIYFNDLTAHPYPQIFDKKPEQVSSGKRGGFMVMVCGPSKRPAQKRSTLAAFRRPRRRRNVSQPRASAWGGRTNNSSRVLSGRRSCSAHCEGVAR